MISLTHILRRWGMLLLSSAFVFHQGAAQKINFGAYTTSQGISLITSGNLNFNDKQPEIVSNSNIIVTITLTDNETQYIKIVGDATRDITVTVSAPIYLTTGASSQIPSPVTLLIQISEAAMRLRQRRVLLKSLQDLPR